ncbi:hypothetical protein AVEN_32561-1 [Araneus ventricosus]|uniref:Uncharacterized protein n=1 Tax=Araneus ventricosus TaxID=182803 RepID=A0A4Y2L341_ARAVE|nr:hypothetical protein AVEN_32561-1 [Araneus ventricosus]
MWNKWIGSGGIQKDSKSKTPSADSDLGPRCAASEKIIVLPRLGPRCSVSEKIIVLPRLGPRVEARKETRNLTYRGRGVWVAGIL